MNVASKNYIQLTVAIKNNQRTTTYKSIYKHAADAIIDHFNEAANLGSYNPQ